MICRRIFDIAKVTLPPTLASVLDIEAPIATKASALSAAELAVHYKDKGVPAHRFAFKEMSAFMSGQTALSVDTLAALAKKVRGSFASARRLRGTLRCRAPVQTRCQRGATAKRR